MATESSEALSANSSPGSSRLLLLGRPIRVILLMARSNSPSARVARRLTRSGFTPSVRDGKVHDLDVRVPTRRNMNVKARKTYIAPPPGGGGGGGR